MFNVDGTAYPITHNGMLTATSSVPGYALLDVVPFRQYHIEPTCSLVLTGFRLARKSDHYYTRCPLSIRGSSVTAARLTTVRGLCVTMRAIIRCLDHKDCLDTHDNVFIYCNDGLSGQEFQTIVESIWIRQVKG